MGHVERTGEISVLIFQSENLQQRDHMENLGLDGRIILKWTLNKYCVIEFNWLGMI
jgi:hypothetical protein